MSLKEILNQPAQFQANVGSTGLDLTAMPIKLQQTLNPPATVDDFNDLESVFESFFDLPNSLFFVVLNQDLPNDSVETSDWAQTFSHPASKIISKATIGLQRTGTFSPGEQIILQIQTTVGGVPSGTSLGSSLPIEAQSVPLPTSAVDFVFSPPVQIQGGVTYALVIRALYPKRTTPVIQIAGKSGNPYANGEVFAFNISTSTWAALQFSGANDFNFKLWEPGARNPLLLTAPVSQLIFQFAPNVTPNGSTFQTANYRQAQTFRLATGKSINRIGVRLSASPAGFPPGDIIVEIQATTGAFGSEVPSGTILGTSFPKAGNTVVGLVSFPPPVFFTTLDFAQPIQLLANVSYAIVVRQTVVNVNQGQIAMYGENSAPNQYVDGRGLLTTNTGTSWSPLTGFILDFDFQLYESAPNTQPIESGGFLQFDYPTATPTSIETVYNSPRGSIELETRFIWTILNNSVFQFTPLEWGLHMLQGTIEAPPLSDSNIASKRLWELFIRPSASSNNLSFIPIVVDASGNRLTQLPSAPTSWQGYSNQGGWFVVPINAAAGVPITVKVLRQPNGGVIFTVYKNDDPNQVVFQTTASPPLRTLTGDIHLDIGHSPEAPGSRFRFDYFKLSGDIIEPNSGEVILRRSYPIKTKVTGYRLDRVSPVPGSKINVRVRAADTLTDLQAAAFSDPAVGTAVGNIETGLVSMPPALFFDVKLEFVKASPGPTLNAFDFTAAQQLMADDLPVILSVDEAGPGLVSAISSEEGASETANTRKLVDGDAAVQWASLNSSDVTPVTLQLTFLAPSGGNELRNVNCLILRNTNLKSLRVFIGGTTLFDGEILEDDVIIPFGLLSTPIVQIEARTTKTANQNKKIGEVYAGQVLLVLPCFDAYDPKRRLFESGDLRTLGGKLVAYRGKDKYAGRWTVRLVDRSTKDELERIFRQNPFVSFWPEPGFRPRDLFDVGWKIEELPFTYTDVVKTAGHTLESEMEEN